MSAEIFAIVISAIGVVTAVLGGMFGGARFLLSRMDRRFDAFGTQMDESFTTSERWTSERFAASEKYSGERFTASDGRFAALHEEISGLRVEVRSVAADVVDLKVAVARIEGPKPRLLPAR